MLVAGAAIMPFGLTEPLHPDRETHVHLLIALVSAMQKRQLRAP